MTPQRTRDTRFHELSVPAIKLDPMTSGTEFVVVDVETSGFDPGRARVLSLAALTVTADGTVMDSPAHPARPRRGSPGPTDIHGLTAPMLAGHPDFADITAELAPMLRDRILVAHNAGFDYAFLAAEAQRCAADLPVTDALCTLELAGRLDLGLDSLSLAALAAHFGVAQARPMTHSTTPEFSPNCFHICCAPPPDAASPCRSARPPHCPCAAAPGPHRTGRAFGRRVASGVTVGPCSTVLTRDAATADSPLRREPGVRLHRGSHCGSTDYGCDVHGRPRRELRVRGWLFSSNLRRPAGTCRRRDRLRSPP